MKTARDMLAVTRRRAPSRSSARLPTRITLSLDAMLALGTFVVLALALLLGGGTQQGYWSDAAVQFASLPLIAAAAMGLAKSHVSRTAKWALILLCIGLALPLIQLIPLPPAIWSAFPGRAAFVKTYRLVGLAPGWAPLSLDPEATWYSFAALLPAAAIFLAVLPLEWKVRRVLVGLVLAISVASVVLGVLQVIGGPDSPLRFFSLTNVDRPVGFFANANHQAALLYSAAPLAFALALDAVHRQNESRSMRSSRAVGNPGLIFKLVAIGLVLAMVAIGLIGTQSRAGLGLGLVAGLSCVAMSRISSRGSAKLYLILLTAILFGLAIYLQFAVVNLAERIDAGEDVAALRSTFATVTWHAVLSFLPLGSGFGSFVPIYDMFSPYPLLGHRYVNHAHNDWLELMLTGGVPVMAFAVCFLVLLAAEIIPVWRSKPDGAQFPNLARGASIVVVLLLVHSTVDYPLRTTAVSALFALACGLLIEPAKTKGVGRGNSPAFQEPDLRAVARP